MHKAKRSTPATKYVVREAGSLADEILELEELSGKSAPIPIVKIASDFGIKTYKASNMSNDISGNIFIGDTTEKDYGADKVIIVGEDEVLPHQRFIITHELAHYLMDYIGSDYCKNKENVFTRAYRKVVVIPLPYTRLPTVCIPHIMQSGKKVITLWHWIIMCRSKQSRAGWVISLGAMSCLR